MPSQARWEPHRAVWLAELQARTEDAVKHGVFGVPSFRIEDGRLFWGQDSMGMMADALRVAQVAQGMAAGAGRDRASVPA